ncbi:lytic murein transglycosylase [Neisseria shayeganii 871]|uniref:Lytic murein transglycosylase n=1 Tax=Neisseria shayeganii 871 TaxID=1032488 RepID=G4CGJ1_9NEIS|nr:lytic murein transglycosylase [Neisseria shayeganii 871]
MSHHIFHILKMRVPGEIVAALWGDFRAHRVVLEEKCMLQTRKNVGKRRQGHGVLPWILRSGSPP